MAVGSFNPSIFQPLWFGSLGLIRPEEAEGAQITFIQPQITDFKTEWFHLQVLQEKLTISCQDPRNFGPLRDLMVSILSKLPHTPIVALGIHKSFHFEMSSVEKWHSLGHVLAPKAIWNDILEKPGLKYLTIEGVRGTSGGKTFITVAPSELVSTGVFMNIHHEFRSDDRLNNARWAKDTLEREWDGFLSFSEETANKLLKSVETLPAGITQ